MVYAIPPHSSEDVLNGNNFTKTWSKFFEDIRQRIGGARAYNLGGLLAVDTTAIGNVGSGEDNLITYSLQKNTLQNAGDSIEITAFGSLAANGNNKTIKLYLGSTQLFSTGAVASSAKDWELKCTIIRTGAATQITSTVFGGDTVLVTQTADYISATEDLTTSLTIKCTGEATSTSDIVQQGLLIKIFPVR